MEPLPSDVEATLLRGIAAYLRATPATELPAPLRRFQNFRPKALAGHKRQILDALDDDGFRALVGEWLEDKPSLAKRDAELLRVAVARADGWGDELAGSSAPKPPPSAPSAGPGEALAREREKLRKARDEGRRRAEEAQRQIAALQARLSELDSEVAAARAETASLSTELAKARKAADRAAADLDRERRKARLAIEKAQAAAAQARGEVKELRREVRSLRSDLDKRKGAPKKKPTAKAAKPVAPKGPRRALPVPKGRFEDDPATLEAWLQTDGVQLLVDGYNASMSKEGFGHLDLAAQRQRLVDGVVKLARRLNVSTTIVFDGSDVSGTSRQPRGPAKVHYSAPDEIADDHLIGLIESMPPVPVVVATSDRELQERAASLGATVASSEQLLSLLR